MTLKKFRWSTTYESAEEELQAQLTRKHITAERWSAEPFEEIDIHVFEMPTRLWCAEGSVSLSVNEQLISLQPGDTIDIPAHQRFDATAGLNGCGLYQANTPAA